MSKDVSAQIEGLLFYHGEPIEKSTLADKLEVRPEIIQKAVASLKADLDQRGLTLMENESAVQLRTDPSLS
ncbi:MAG: SMC-Scp complex subunit ScpB, partial [Parcubacteria group bacterium SW_4_46_8]